VCVGIYFGEGTDMDSSCQCTEMHQRQLDGCFLIFWMIDRAKVDS
jgi:hypothetical protein